jgi:hypothetical protein
MAERGITPPKEIGRPTVVSPEVIRKLEEVFAIGGTDAEACFYADIGKTAFYNYQLAHPEFTERKNQLKQKPFLLARQTIVGALTNPVFAFEYMKRKKKDEFSERSEMLGKFAVAETTLEDLIDDGEAKNEKELLETQKINLNENDKLEQSLSYRKVIQAS